MAPTAVEVELINEIIQKEPAVTVEHNIDDHVAFGTHQVLCLIQPPYSPLHTC